MLEVDSIGSVNEDVVSEEKLFWGDLLASVTERIVRSEVDIVAWGGLFVEGDGVYGVCFASLVGWYRCMLFFSKPFFEEGFGFVGELESIGGEK